MRPRYKTPVNKRYFHTKRKIDSKDIFIIKKKIRIINQRKLKEKLSKRDRKNLYRNI